MTTIVTVKVSIVQANDEVAIQSFVILGRGDTLPSGAEWVDKETGQWMREPNKANLENEIARTAGLERPIKSYRLMDALEGEQYEKCLVDRVYRKAWRDTGAKVEVDMPVAREVHRDKIRVARAKRFVDMDAEWMKDIGQKKQEEADAVEAKRQELRDLTADPKIDQAKTPEELKATWREDLLGPLK